MTYKRDRKLLDHSSNSNTGEINDLGLTQGVIPQRDIETTTINECQGQQPQECLDSSEHGLGEVRLDSNNRALRSADLLETLRRGFGWKNLHRQRPDHI